MLATNHFIPRQPPLIHKAVTVTHSAPRTQPPVVKPPPSGHQPQPSPAAAPVAPSQPAPTASLCKHVAQLVKTAPEAASHFALGVRWSLRLASGGNAKRRKVRHRYISLAAQSSSRTRSDPSQLEPPSCRVCAVGLARPLLCLDCGLTLCGSRDGPDHAKAHAKSKGHELCTLPLFVCEIRSGRELTRRHLSLGPALARRVLLRLQRLRLPSRA